MPALMDREQLASRLSALGLVAGYGAHFAVVVWFAVDLPFWDEWAQLADPRFSRRFSLGWLLAPNNEHVIVWTKLEIWLLLRLNGWNLASAQVLNFGLYGLLLAAFWRWDARLRGKPSPVTAGFLAFLLSPLGYENHTWGFQSQFHFALLFTLAGLWLCFDARRGLGRRALGTTALVAAVFAMGAGLVMALGVAVSLLGFELGAARPGAPRRRVSALLVAAAVALAALIWGLVQPPTAGHGAPAWPTEAAFWRFFVNLASLGFGFESKSLALGSVTLFLLLAPALGMCIRAVQNGEPRDRELAACLVALLAALAAIAVGRAGAGVDGSKSHRYVMIAALLVAVAASGWSRLLMGRDRARRGVVALLFALSATGFLDDWTLWGYRERELRKQLGLVCVERYYLDRAPGRCPSVWSEPIDAALARAPELGVSFYEELAARWGQGERLGSPR